ncbi:hypothetical protein [Vallicoccus soli]|uniref:Extradiol ring-cleavage dioxygenase class III enzyme subunit B domain-containing protein n=1 Tax=Vallicoccus soli TaxID=2339232 RepID=A0A3A3Z1Q8_9ACTN|nr:hypothetical protein [Vallicoccus soli]RJK96467.1 hypothetical protein D5H78_09635 [Vallicoccus soli]
MLVAAAVVPHPPLLVPGLSGREDVLAAVRGAALGAVGRLLAAGPDVVAVVGAGTAARRHPASAAGSLAPYGLPVRVGGDGPPVLPLSLTVGRWLLGRAGADGDPLLEELDPAGAPGAWRAAGEALAAAAPRVALLAAGDGSARTTERSPGWVDPRAADWDAACAAALGSGDPAALAALDPALGHELLAAGVPAWHALAGAAAGGRWRADLGLHAAPLGVSYLVASWAQG